MVASIFCSCIRLAPLNCSVFFEIVTLLDHRQFNLCLQLALWTTYSFKIRQLALYNTATESLWKFVNGTFAYAGRTGSKIYKFVNVWMLLSGCSSITGNNYFSVSCMVYIVIILLEPYCCNTQFMIDARSSVDMVCKEVGLPLLDFSG